MLVVGEARSGQGREFVGNVDRLVTTLLTGCDGRRPLREILADLTKDLGTEMEQMVPAGIGVVRKLLASGFLTAKEAPASTGDRTSGACFVG